MLIWVDKCPNLSCVWMHRRMTGWTWPGVIGLVVSTAWKVGGQEVASLICPLFKPWPRVLEAWPLYTSQATQPHNCALNLEIRLEPLSLWGHVPEAIDTMLTTLGHVPGVTIMYEQLNLFGVGRDLPLYLLIYPYYKSDMWIPGSVFMSSPVPVGIFVILVTKISYFPFPLETKLLAVLLCHSYCGTTHYWFTWIVQFIGHACFPIPNEVARS